MFFLLFVACSVYAGDEAVPVPPVPVCPEGQYPLEEMCVTKEQNDKVLAASEDVRPLLIQEIRVQKQVEQAIATEQKLDAILREVTKQRAEKAANTPAR